MLMNGIRKMNLSEVGLYLVIDSFKKDPSVVPDRIGESEETILGIPNTEG